MMDALGRHLADSTVFALTVALLCLCMRRRGPAARHSLWLIAAAKFVLPMALFSWLGESLRGLLLPTQVSAGIPAVLSRWVISPVILEPSNAGKTGHFHPLIFIWLAGSVAAFALWLPKLWISCRSPNHAGDWDETSFLRLRGRIGLQRDVRLRFSDEVPEPVLAGFRRPVVIIPADLRRQLAPAELDSVILHELAHARRWDNLTSAFAHSVTCIFWFYPLLWWIERRLHRERELACDEMVVRCGASPEDYLAGILKVCRSHLSADVAGVSGVCGSNLKKRMEVIMSVSSDKPSPRTPKTLVGTLIAAIVGIPLLIGFVAASNALATHPNAQRSSLRARLLASSRVLTIPRELSFRSVTGMNRCAFAA
jgi:bla regulator protein blaR1